jgi:hypothetical protein
VAMASHVSFHQFPLYFAVAFFFFIWWHPELALEEITFQVIGLLTLQPIGVHFSRKTLRPAPLLRPVRLGCPCC